MIGDDNDPDDGELALLVVDGDGLWLKGQRAGAAMTAKKALLKEQRAAVLQAIRTPEENLAVLGSDASAVRSLFEFAFAQAQHCKGISGSETRLFCQCNDIQTLDAVRAAAAADDNGVECAAILADDPKLWATALS